MVHDKEKGELGGALGNPMYAHFKNEGVGMDMIPILRFSGRDYIVTPISLFHNLRLSPHYFILKSGLFHILSKCQLFGRKSVFSSPKILIFPNL